MSSYSRNSTVAGILFLIAMISSLAGGGLLESILNEFGYLINISVNTSKMFIGVILEFINGIAVIGIAVILYPIFKQYSESITPGYISSRIVESVFCLVNAAIPFSLIKLSGEYMNAGTRDASDFYTLGNFLTQARFNLAEILIPASFGIGALLFYFLLYRSKLTHTSFQPGDLSELC